MITIKSIVIKSIRGIKVLELALNGKSLILLGENGTGKSSIVDALEFFFTGTISHLTGSKVLSVKNHGKHSSSTKSDVEVTLEFNPGGVKLTKTFSSDFLCPEHYKSMFDEAKKGTFILRRSQIMQFIQSNPSERFDLISKILGFNNLDKFEDNFKRVVHHFEETLEVMNNTKSTLLDQLSEQLPSKIQNIGSILNIVNDKLQSLAFPSLTSLNDIDIYTSNLLRKYSNLLDESKLNTLLKIQTITSSLKMDQIDNKINEFNMTRQNISRTELTNIRFINLLNEGKKVITDNNLNECPLCENKIDNVQTISNIDRRMIQLNTIDENVSKLRKDLTDIIDSLREIKSIITELDISIHSFEIEFHNQLESVKEIINKLDNLTNTIILGKELITTINYDEFSDVSNLIENAVKQSIKKAEDLHNNIKSNNGENVIQIIKILENISSKLDSLKKIDEQTTLVKQELSISETIKKSFLDSKNNNIQKIHETIEKDIEMFYSIIHPNEDHGNIKLIVDPLKNGSTNLQVQSYDKLVDPRAFQSEGHLDSLGLCIFLAFIKRFNKECSLVVLDDIVSTIDSNHRGRICNLLYSHFPEKQFIITTCDGIWYDQLVNSQKAFGCHGKFENKIIMDWNLEQGPILSGYLPRSEKIKDKLKRGDKTGAANEIRQYLEWLLKNICENIKAEVIFRSSGRFTVADLFSPSKRRISKLSKNQGWEQGILARYQALEAMTPVANLLSHDNLDAINISKNEVQDLFDAVVGLHQSFQCHSCEELLHYIQDSKILRCVNNRCKDPTIFKTS